MSCLWVQVLTPIHKPIGSIISYSSWKIRASCANCLAGKMEVYVMLGSNGYTVACGGTEAPVPQYSNDSFIHAMAETLKQSFLHHCALSINGNFHDYITLNAAGQL